MMAEETSVRAAVDCDLWSRLKSCCPQSPQSGAELDPGALSKQAGIWTK